MYLHSLCTSWNLETLFLHDTINSKSMKLYWRASPTHHGCWNRKLLKKVINFLSSKTEFIFPILVYWVILQRQFVINFDFFWLKEIARPMQRCSLKIVIAFVLKRRTQKKTCKGSCSCPKSPHIYPICPALTLIRKIIFEVHKLLTALTVQKSTKKHCYISENKKTAKICL